jgi:hypothetical protein
MNKLRKQIHYSNATLSRVAQKATLLRNNEEEAAEEEEEEEDSEEEVSEEEDSEEENPEDNNNDIQCNIDIQCNNNDDFNDDDNSSNENFDIIDSDNNGTPNWILGEIESLNKKKRKAKFPMDHNQLVLSDKSNLTVGEFSRLMHRGCHEFNVTTAQELFFLKLVSATFPTAKFPVRRDSQRMITASKVTSYVEPAARMLQFDACINGCIIFSLKYCYHTRCPRCNSERFYQCSNIKCKFKSYDECPHDVDSIYRVARKLLYYRPIQQTLKELLSKPGFLMALNYKFIKAKDSNYEDVQDGINFKKHQNQMNKIYKRRKENEIGLQLKKVNIFISQFRRRRSC